MGDRPPSKLTRRDRDHGKAEDAEHTKASHTSPHEQLLRALGSLAGGVVVLDEAGRFSYANPAFAAWVGCTPETLLGRHIAEVASVPRDAAESAPAEPCPPPLLEAGQVVQNGELELVTANGSTRAAAYAAAAVVADERGHESGAVALLIDLTARRQQERELRQSIHRLTVMLDASELATWEWDVRTGVFTFGEGWARMLSYPPDALSPKFSSWEQLLHPEDRPRVIAALAEHLSGASPQFRQECRLRTRSDNWRWVRCCGRVTERDADGRPLHGAGVNFDIHAQKQAQRAVQEQGERFRAVFEDGPLGVAFVESDYRPIAANARLCDLLGASEQQLATRSLLDVTHPDDVEAEARLVAQLFSGQLSHFSVEKRFMRCDGTVIWTSVTASAVVGAEGIRPYGLCLVEDIQKRKRVELELRQANELLEERVRERTEQLRVANRELEDFASSVAHDLRAPLRRIDGFSLALLEDYGDRLDAPGQDYLGRVRSGARHMGTLIDDLLRLSRVSRAELRWQVVDLTALAEQAAAVLQEAYSDRHVLLEIEPGQQAYGDPALLRTALENLISNAFKFSSRVPEPRVKFGSISSSGKATYFVADNGAGFDMKSAARLFRPFQRLHAEAEFPGTGVGLATVRRVVERHGGQIWTESAVGQGATFYFTLHAPGPGKGATGPDPDRAPETHMAAQLGTSDEFGAARTPAPARPLCPERPLPSRKPALAFYALRGKLSTSPPGCPESDSGMTI